MAKKQYTPPRMQKATREEVYRKERLRIMNSGQSDRWQRRQAKNLDRWFNQKNPYKNTAPKQSSEGRALQSGSRARSRRVPGFSGTVGQFVSLLLVVVLIGTLFFAVDNARTPEEDAFYYVSPSKFLEGFTEVTYVEGDTYVVNMIKVSDQSVLFPALSSLYYRGWIDVNGRRYDSDNALSATSLESGEQFEFIIDGTTYFSHTIEFQGPRPEFGQPGWEGRAVTLPGTYVNWLVQPDWNAVLYAWRGVDNFSTFGNALSTTAGFIGDWFTYQGNLLSAVLPWNSVAQGSRDHLHTILPPLE